MEIGKKETPSLHALRRHLDSWGKVSEAGVGWSVSDSATQLETENGDCAGGGVATGCFQSFQRCLSPGAWPWGGGGGEEDGSGWWMVDGGEWGDVSAAYLHSSTRLYRPRRGGCLWRAWSVERGGQRQELPAIFQIDTEYSTLSTSVCPH
ncbi:hypothetical protein N431DRAFT_174568 [Stipitochalara longipes BDJ]|nr:hypothetical protein N431DRAFT_174568 [Stipitochalara longipes BDJ]